MSKPQKPRKETTSEQVDQTTVVEDNAEPVSTSTREETPEYPGSRDLCVPGVTYRMPSGGTVRFS